MKARQLGFGVVEVIIIVVIIALVGVGGWYVWSSNQQPSPSATNQNDTALPPPSDSTKKTFSDDSAPFAFEYPKDWTLKASPTLTPGQPLPDDYSITLETPDIGFGEMPIGGTEVNQGAQVVVRMSKSTLQDVHGVFTGLRASAQNKSDTTVAGQAAVEYEYGYESQPGHYFDFLHNGRLYSVSYFSAGNERESGNYASYIDMVKSLSLR